MANFVTRCPACHAELRASRLSCTQCETQIDGQFEIPSLLRLAPQDLAFVTTFIKRSGSLKAMAEAEGTSYPTVRNRLNDIIQQLEAADQAIKDKQHKILDALEKGSITAVRAARELQKVGR